MEGQRGEEGPKRGDQKGNDPGVKYAKEDRQKTYLIEDTMQQHGWYHSTQHCASSRVRVLISFLRQS